MVNNRRLKMMPAVFMIVFLLLINLCGCGPDKETVSEGKEAGDTFIVGFDAEFPPYGYKDENGEYVGFDLELAEEVCRRNGWEIRKQPIDWNSKDMELSTGMIDCIWNGFTINGRENSYTWSSAYVDNSQVVIVKSTSSIRKLSDLAGKNVIVQSDSSALAAFAGKDATQENISLAASFSSLQQVSDYNSAFMNLESGVADAICMDIGVANYEINERGSSFVMLTERVSKEEYGIGFKKGNTALRNQVQDTLDKMLADGTFLDIAKKWELEENVCLGQPDAKNVMKNEKTSDSEKEGFGKGLNITLQLAEGMGASLAIFALTLIFSMPLGLVITFGSRSKNKIIHIIARVYISIVRGTPLMLQLLVVFFAPYYIFGISLSASYRFIAVIIGFSLNYAAYFAEIYRAGIESIPVGQLEAASVLGFSNSQTFVRIIFPQMIKRVLPPVTNEIITLVKDTSLAFALAYTEIFTIAKQVAAADASILPLFVAGVFYYVFNVIVARVMNYIEKRLNYYQ